MSSTQYDDEEKIFNVGISMDFQTEAQGLLEPILDEKFGPYPFIQWEYFDFEKVVKPSDVLQYDAVISLFPIFQQTSFAGIDRLAVIARWGVGYDMIDVPACTKANVLLAITSDASKKPVAEAIVTLFLVLAKRLVTKDRLVRIGRWDLKSQYSGLGLRGKVVGSIGLGHVGSEMFRLIENFDLSRKLVYDPFISPEKAERQGVELVDLETVFRESDFLAINCPLTSQTQGMVDANLFRLMKPTAFFVNTARGQVVNEADLITALSEGWFAGAGLDVFEHEPLPLDNPLLQLDSVILTPHALAWTDDLYRGLGVRACENVLEVFQGNIPTYSVNRTIADQPVFKKKINGLNERWQRLSERLQF